MASTLFVIADMSMHLTVTQGLRPPPPSRLKGPDLQPVDMQCILPSLLVAKWCTCLISNTWNNYTCCNTVSQRVRQVFETQHLCCIHLLNPPKLSFFLYSCISYILRNFRLNFTNMKIPKKITKLNVEIMGGYNLLLY